MDEILNDYELIEFWRENLPIGDSVKLPRLILGRPAEYVLELSEDESMVDAIIITKTHLDNMTNKEVIEYIQSKSHTIH